LFVFTANSGIVMSCCFETRTAKVTDTFFEYVPLIIEMLLDCPW